MAAFSPTSHRLNSLLCCATAGVTAAICEALRALTQSNPAAPAYVLWCAMLMVGASVALGIPAAVGRASAGFALVAWLSLAATLVHGWQAAIAFATVALALGFLGRRELPSALTLAVGISALFEISAGHADRLGGLVGAGLIPRQHADMVQHAGTFGLLGITFLWLSGLSILRASPRATALVLLCLGAAVSARDFARGGRDLEVPRSAHAAVEPVVAGPSVLLLVLDTVRADHLSVYGYARRTTPELERLLRERPDAVLYRDAYANGTWTVPGHAAMLSGQLASVHGADFAGRQEHDPLAVAIHPEVPMLAEALKAKGWATFGVFANRWLATAQGLGRGFERFGPVDSKREMEPLGEALRQRLAPSLRARDVTTYPDAPAVGTRLIDELQRVGQRQFFGLANFMDAHGPHVPLHGVAGEFGPWSVFDPVVPLELQTPHAVRARLVDRYDEQILFLDRELGRLLDQLDERGVLERTWVFILSNHGEAFGEHGVVDHGSAVYDEIVRIPLLVLPPRGESLARAEGPVSQIDVAATIAAIAGVNYQGPGRDLRAAVSDRSVQIQHGAAPFRELRHGKLAGREMRAVVRGQWKLCEVAGALQLFDLRADPGETRDLASERPELVLELGALLPEPMLQAAPVGQRAAGSFAVEKELKQLGY